jgi:sigma-B regulation protein RsbU (phosphoserine phosphatase)
VLGGTSTDDRHRAGRFLKALPGLAIVAIVASDLSVGDSIVLGLAAVAPLLASNVTGPWATAGYGLVALATALLLGVHNDAYRPGDPLRAQSVRLGAIVLITMIAVLMAHERVLRESRLARMTAVAEVAQRAILPTMPDRVGPARIAVHYESATSDALVGGDLYATALTPHGLRVLVGDVRGKGLDAVRLAAQVLAAFRERADDDGDLRVLVDHLDRSVDRSATDEDFVTTVIAQLRDDGTVMVATAGHPPPLLFADGAVTPLAAAEPRAPLGLAGGGCGVASPVVLDPGDRLLLYTDGLTEARDPRTRAFLPDDVITRAISDPRGIEDGLAVLRDDVIGWTRGTLHDDIALVLIEYSPGMAPSSAHLA